MMGLRRACRGSMTVEASILIPMILFLLIALIYMAFFLHDRSILQSAGLRAAERQLWQSTGTGTESSGTGSESLDGMNGENEGGDGIEVPTLMMSVTDFSINTEGFVQGVIDFLGSQSSAKVHASGQLSVGIGGSAVFIGNELSAEKEMQAIRVDYRDDRLRVVVLREN